MSFSQKPPHAWKGSTLIGAVVGCWFLAVGGGLALLWRHGFTAGPAATVQPTWPTDLALPRSNNTATLIMTVHPECPCSRASMVELEALMARCDGKLDAYVLFAQPAGLNNRVESTALWKSAAQIPGVKAIIDKDGARTRRLGAETSGQVFVYDGGGVLRFSGGLTLSRGHEGDSDGMAAIVAIVRSGTSPIRCTPVYGCKIW